MERPKEYYRVFSAQAGVRRSRSIHATDERHRQDRRDHRDGRENRGIADFVDRANRHRHHVAGLPDQATGWLAASRDAVVGKCLALLHRRPEHPWTIAELAAAVGISRSVLMERFTRYLSDSPIAYLTSWRLRLAAQALTSSAKGVADIAAGVGYESEAAFNRAFKRAFGVPPARYRRQKREVKSN